MENDVLIVDDEKDWVDTISEMVDIYNGNPIGYTDFNDALEFVVERVGNIYACFVDMKPLRVFEGDNLTESDKQTLELPEKIFYAVKEKGWNDNFYFISAHKSENDIKVLGRTKANYIDKWNLDSIIIERFFRYNKL